MKALLYARKSTDDKTHQVLSIETQLFELRNLAARLGIPIEEEITEEKTARLPGRKRFADLIQRVLAGEADTIICWKLHRLARNFDDGGKIITLLQTGAIQAIHTLEKTYTPQDNVLLLAIEFGIATQFSKDLSNDVRLGLKAKLREGGWPGIAPVGYLNDRANKVIVVNPAQANLVKHAFHLVACGDYNISEIWRRITQAGLCSPVGKGRIARSAFEKILKNPFYYGVMRYRGELAPGKHEPLINKELFDRVQKLLSDRHKPRKKPLKDFVYRGVFRCFSCACLVTMDIQKGHRYLRCTKRVGCCGEKYLREEIAHEQIASFIAGLAIPASLPAKLREAVDYIRKEEYANQQARLASLQAEQSAIDGEIDKLLQLLMKELITEQEYVNRKNSLVAQRVQLVELAKKEKTGTNRFEPAEALILELNEAILTANVNDIASRRDFVRRISSNRFLSSGQLRVELKSRWKTYMEWQKSLPSPFEKIPVGYQLTLLCSLIDKVRTVE